MAPSPAPPAPAATPPSPSAADQEERLRELVAAGTALAAELDLEGVLARLVRIAADLTGSRYAALGVLARSGAELERFVTHGVDDETRARIGSPPQGRGILGALIHEARPLRLSAIADDPRSVGFPPGHPPMTSFLGVPITIRGVPYGNLYLAEKIDGGSFTDGDEDILSLLASQAGAAIENARLYESATGWARQLEILLDVSRSLSEGAEPSVVLRLICERVLDITHAETAMVVLPTPEGRMSGSVVVGEAAALISRMSSRRSGKIGLVLERGHAARVDDALTDPEIDQGLAREINLRSALMVPMRLAEEGIGVLVVMNRRGGDGRFSDADLRLTELFAHRAAQAISLSWRVSRDTVRRVLESQEQERRRLGAALHDETAQALAVILMGIRSVEDASSDAERGAACDRLRQIADEALGRVRQLSHQLRPPTLQRHGLASALRGLAEDFAETGGLEVHAHVALSERVPEALETTLFRIAQEALANVVKHASARRASVLVTEDGPNVVMLVEDDGLGFDPSEVPTSALGLLSMHERVEFHGGHLEVQSRPGSGTVIRARIPRRGVSRRPLPRVPAPPPA